MSAPLALGTVHIGDVRDFARLLAPGSVNCIVTSPPYFGLRDYGTARWEGGEDTCDHVDARQRRAFGPANTLGPGGHLPETNALGVAGVRQYRDVCGKCGAVRADRQLGLEGSVGEFVANLVGVFRLLRPALRDDGTLWLNMGDSYANNPSTSTMRRSEQGNGTGAFRVDDTHMSVARQPANRLTPLMHEGYPPKCLTLVPARVALALIDDGWVLRSELTGIKTAPMPESARDRPTSATEKVYLFAKRSIYWYDAVAVAEPAVHGAAGSTFTAGKTGHNGLGRVSALPREEGFTRNARNWFFWRPEPFGGAHYATFPSSIPRFAIRAGCPPRVCARCGAPWVRVVADSPANAALKAERGRWGGADGDAGRDFGRRERGRRGAANGRELAALGPTKVTTGWSATCACGPAAGVRPGVALDPFLGSGTTAQVAVEEGRDWLGIDLDERSVGWTAERLAKTQIRLPLDGTEAAGG